MEEHTKLGRPMLKLACTEENLRTRLFTTSRDLLIFVHDDRHTFLYKMFHSVISCKLYKEYDSWKLYAYIYIYIYGYIICLVDPYRLLHAFADFYICTSYTSAY